MDELSETPSGSSASSADKTPPPPSSPAETIKEYLVGLSTDIIKSWDGSLDEDHPFAVTREFCCKEFHTDKSRSKEHPFGYSQNLEDHIEIVAELKRVNPAWSMQGVNFNTTLDREHEHAIVWFTSLSSGGPSGYWSTNRESVSQLRWRWNAEDGKWWAYTHIILRGGGSMGEFGI